MKHITLSDKTNIETVNINQKAIIIDHYVIIDDTSKTDNANKKTL